MRPEVREFMPKVKRVPMEGKGTYLGRRRLHGRRDRHEARQFTIRQEHAPGSPEEPMTAADRVEKFMDCAGRVFGEKGATGLLEQLENLGSAERRERDGGDVAEGRDGGEGDGLVI